MTTRRAAAPRHHILHLEVAAPKNLSEDEIRLLIESVLGPTTAKPAPVTVTKAKAPRVVLRNRKTRKTGAFACRREPTGLMAASVIWPMGVPHKGCGRTFTTEKRRDIHESGKDWNPVMFPNGCLDRVLPAEMRDTR